MHVFALAPDLVASISEKAKLLVSRRISLHWGWKSQKQCVRDILDQPE